MSVGRATRQREQEPRSMPWAVNGEPDVVAVDTTWGVLQPIQLAAGVRTLGELEVIEAMAQGARLVDSRTAGSTWGRTLPGAVSLPHDEVIMRIAELDRDQLSVLFCNGPQCPQSPEAIAALIEAGYPADSLAYYRGGMHDWVTLALPTSAAQI